MSGTYGCGSSVCDLSCCVAGISQRTAIVGAFDGVIPTGVRPRSSLWAHRRCISIDMRGEISLTAGLHFTLPAIYSPRVIAVE